MLAVVSGQTVVHRASTNASTTARPRNWLSDTRLPSWLVSVNPGAASPGSAVPGSTAPLPPPAPPGPWLAIDAGGRLAPAGVITATTAASTTGTAQTEMTTARRPARPAFPAPGHSTYRAAALR